MNSRCSPQTARSAVADLAQGGLGLDGIDDRRAGGCRCREPRARAGRARAARPTRHATARRAAIRATCSRSSAGSMRCRAGRDDLVVGEAVDAHHDALSRLDLALHPVGGVLDLALLVARLDGRDGATHGVDLVEVALRGGLQLVGQRLDVVGAGQRVGRVGDAALVGDDLLGAQGEARRSPAWAAPAPRRGSWCAGSACRPAPRPAPAAWCAPRCCPAAGR